MSNLFKPENRRIIETLNKGLGTKHRTKPYNLGNPNDLKDALMLAFAAFRDYQHYMNSLIAMSENFDESLENFDTISWVHLDTEPEKSNEIVVECEEALGEAIGKFEKLTDRAKDNFIEILAISLTASTDTQKAVFGSIYNINHDEMDAKLDELFEILSETDYEYSIPGNLDVLLNVMATEWSVGK